jgi:hypothetical protein
MAVLGEPHAPIKAEVARRRGLFDEFRQRRRPSVNVGLAENRQIHFTPHFLRATDRDGEFDIIVALPPEPECRFPIPPGWYSVTADVEVHQAFKAGASLSRINATGTESAELIFVKEGLETTYEGRPGDGSEAVLSAFEALSDAERHTLSVPADAWARVYAALTSGRDDFGKYDYLYITAQTGRPELAATDGVWLFFETFQGEVAQDFPGVAVPKRAANFVSRFAAKGADVTAHIYETRHVYLTFSVGGLRVTVRTKAADVHIPDYRRLIPENDAALLEVTFSAADMARAMSDLGKAVDKDAVLTFRFDSPDEVALAVKRPGRGIRASFPAQVTFRDPTRRGLTLGLRLFYARGIARAFGRRAAVRLYVHEPTRPMVFTSPDRADFGAVVMPIPLHN